MSQISNLISIWMILVVSLVNVKQTACDCFPTKLSIDLVLQNDGECPGKYQWLKDDWIIIMQRLDGTMNFDRNWADYRNGFGETRGSNFWIGLEKMHCITNQTGAAYELRIEVQGLATGVLYYANYEQFSVGSESTNYRLNLNGYSGDAGDSMTNTSIESRWHLNGKQFSTPDRDNDISPDTHCARKYNAGWWFGSCWYSCPSCQYGTNDFSWHTLNDAGLENEGKLRFCRMMIRRK